MTPERWQEVRRLYHACVDLDAPARGRLLESACAGDGELKSEVQSLLDITDRGGDFMETPAAEGSFVMPDNGQVSEIESLVEVATIGPRLSDLFSIGLTPGERVGAYRVIRELGVGGMAEVWLAERADGSFQRQVALKLPKQTWLRKDLAERFTRERNILAGLEHPHIGRLYDAGLTHEGLPYLAMEYVPGIHLIDWCDQQRLGVPERLKLFLQVLGAVQYAHERQVIHRDIKPANILVTHDGEVRLLDFGIAKLMTDGTAQETALTQIGGRALSLQYASPEQILGEPLSAFSDIYSLGVVLHELLTGSLPYRLIRSSKANLEEAILSAVPTKASESATSSTAAARNATPREVIAVLKGDIDAILHKALKKNPAERYESAKALADDIERYLRGQKIEAKPEAMGSKAARFFRKRRLTAIAAVPLVSMLGAVAWIGANLDSRANEPPAMSVVIMPFTAEASDAPALHLASSLQHELTTGLVTCCHDTKVAATARYRVEGDVHSTKDGKTVNLMLIDTVTGNQVGTIQFELVDIDGQFESLRRLRRLVGKLHSAIVKAETRRTLFLPLEKLGPMELVLRGNSVSGDSQTLDTSLEAQKLYDAALRLNPYFVPALTAQSDNWDALNDVDPKIDHGHMLRQMEELSLRAVKLDPTDPNAWDTRFLALVDAGRWTAAQEANSKLMSLDPFHPNPYSNKAWTMILLGRPADALPVVEQAIALEPGSPNWALRMACEAHLMLGQDAWAIPDCEKASTTISTWYLTSFLVAAYANHGDLDKAAAAKPELLRLFPGMTIAQLRAKRYSDVPEYVKMAEFTWYAGLRKAGIPEK